ncbi:MAG: HAD family hydrolase [Rickettsiales bacterium]|jgi:beta-phosphoglucomutase-like phosphatase (HAD superfamily)|nr:HAD family hydrolase [Rickettsiales bacterium]
MVIFDFDGVIALNTEKITMGVIAKLIGRPAEEVAELVMGLNGKALIDELRNAYGVSIVEEQIMNARMEIMKQKGVLKKDPFLLPFLDELRKRGVEYAIATSSSRAPINIAIENLNLSSYFNAIYSIDDYPNFRSKRELYTLLGQKYKNKEIFVIEDSLRGIENAYNSGVGKVIAYTGCGDKKQFNRQYFEQIKNKTIGVVSSFEEVYSLL